MPVYRLQFRGCTKRTEEDFRDLAHAKSEAMRRAADIAELDATEGAWAARIYQGDVLLHEIPMSDIAHGEQRHREVPAEQANGLDEGIAESFPASDPPAAVSPTVATKEK